MWRNDVQNASLNFPVKFFVAMIRTVSAAKHVSVENDLKKQGHSNTKEKHK